jgi:hypothetical protein
LFCFPKPPGRRRIQRRLSTRATQKCNFSTLHSPRKSAPLRENRTHPPRGRQAHRAGPPSQTVLVWTFPPWTYGRRRRDQRRGRRSRAAVAGWVHGGKVRDLDDGWSTRRAEGGRGAGRGAPDEFGRRPKRLNRRGKVVLLRRPRA